MSSMASRPFLSRFSFSSRSVRPIRRDSSSSRRPRRRRVSRPLAGAMSMATAAPTIPAVRATPMYFRLCMGSSNKGTMNRSEQANEVPGYPSFFERREAGGGGEHEEEEPEERQRAPSDLRHGAAHRARPAGKRGRHFVRHARGAGRGEVPLPAPRG